MFFLQKIRKSVAKIDMFSSSEMLRYNEDPQYQTFTGGVISLGIILTVIASFFSLISETVNRTAINSTLNVITSGNPAAFNLTTNTDSMFMFGIQIQSMDQVFFYDASATKRYFDVEVLSGTLKYGILEKLEKVSMVSCTDQHWEMIPDLVKNKGLTQYNTWLCPQINAQLPLAGSYFSDVYQSIQISVRKCTNESDQSRPCYPQNEIDDLMNTYGNFYFQVNYLNTVINPNEVNYRSYYIQSMDYVIFSATQGSQIYYQFSDYQIETDTSIWPFSSINVDKGALVPSKAIGISFTVDSETYVLCYFTKSQQSLLYSRQVQKLQVVFSYIGGLVGAISTLLFILKAYTDTSLEISIAKNLFNEEHIDEQDKNELNSQSEDASQKEQKSNQQQLKYNKFGLSGFIKLHIYQLFKGFQCTENWNQGQKLEQWREQISKHLDIKNLLKRIINIERYLTYVFNQKQLECLKHQKPMTIDQIKYLRRLFSSQNNEENSKLKQSAVIEKQIIQIDPNLCNQQLDISISAQSEVRSPQPFFKSIHIFKSSNKVQPLSEQQVIFQKKKKSERRRSFILSNSDDQKMKQYFSELQSEKDDNIINRKICENAKSHFFLIKEAKNNNTRVEQSRIKERKVKDCLIITPTSDLDQQ